MADKLSGPLQESILCLLATNNQEGAIAAGLLSPKVFDQGYQDLAQRILVFRKTHNKAPGKEHLDDLVDDIIGNKDHKARRATIRILEGVLGAAEGLNAKYVLSRINEFAKRQRLKSAILEAGDIYQAGRETLADEIEVVLQKALKPDIALFDVGLRLNEKRALNFLTSMKADFKTGIPELDRVEVGPTYGQLLMLMAAKGVGKSWWCIDIGRRCIMQGAKVLHITLEMSEDLVSQRYYQNFFALGKRKEKFNVIEFELDRLNRLAGFNKLKRRVHMSLDSPRIDRYLNRKQRNWGTKLGRLVIKGFPTKSLSIPKLDAYLDMLEMQEKFIPNVLILDYPDLMWLDKKDIRVSIGWTVEEFRGLLQRRHLAGVAPTQTSKKGWEAETVKGSMVAEDASKFRTADQVLIYSRTAMEKSLGLARLHLEKNRNDEDGFDIVISQNYTTGQFILSSVRMSSTYHELLGDNGSEDEDEEGDSD